MAEASPPADSGGLFERWRAGGADADADELITPTLYAELRQLASHYLRQERPGHTLLPTALVHEAIIRLFGSRLPATDRSHFIALAARTMRQVLVDHARYKRADKRLQPEDRVPLDVETLTGDLPRLDVLELDEALNQLAQVSPRAAKIVELRFFGGLTNPEASEALGVSLSSVEREWRAARAWLRNALSP